jgi:hypothetical protein
VLNIISITYLHGTCHTHNRTPYIPHLNIHHEAILHNFDTESSLVLYKTHAVVSSAQLMQDSDVEDYEINLPSAFAMSP